MLGSAKKPALARRQQFLVIAMFLGSCTSLALCTSGDDDLIRLASRSVPPKAETSTHFNRGASQPWDEIGVQSGYFRLLPSAAAVKPAIKSTMEWVADQLQISNLECGVKLSRDFLSWTSNLELKIIDRNDTSPDGRRYELKLIGDKPVLEFSREVDWAEVAEKIRWGVFAPEENVSALKKFIHEQGRAKTLRIITNDSSYYGDYVFAKSLWPVVDGGVTAAVFPLAELAKIDPEYKREDVTEVACLNVLRQCRFMGIGVDLQNEASLCQLRLALVPRKEHTAEEILQQVNAVLASILETTRTTDQLSDDEKQSQVNWRAELETWHVSTQRVEGEIGEIVLIEGSTSDARILIPLM